MKKNSKLSRRDFVQTTLGVGVALSVPNLLGAESKGQGRLFKVGLIGCGGRGRGAAQDALEAGKILGFDVRITALADFFKDRAINSSKFFNVPADRCFGGPTCYQQLHDFFSVDYDYGDGVHIHSMCRQVNNCYNWTGHDFVYEKGRTNGSDYPKPRQSPIPDDLPQGPSSHHQEQIDTLYHVNKGVPLDQARAVAESSATAVLGRISAYTGKQVLWDDIMGNPNQKPALYNLALKPTAEDFEKGTVEIPKENVVPVAGRS